MWQDMIPACDLDEAAAQTKYYLVTLDRAPATCANGAGGGQNSNSTGILGQGLPRPDP